MQIKLHLNGAQNEISENVVQKILKTPHSRQNESAHREWMYIQVSSMSYCKLERSPVDKLKLHCLYLLKYLFLLLYGRYHWAIIEISPHKSLVLLRENFSINRFCDLSTNGRGSKCGIELSSILTTEKLRKTLNSFFYGILLIQRHLNYEFSDNHHEHRILLLAHNQIADVTSPCQSHYLLLLLAFYSSVDNNCHATLSIENGISTSNHKLKMSPTTHQRHRHRRSSNDSVKSHLNAILFLIILCIPLLTTTATASSVHNLKYSTNVVKTKYGPLRGIILRQNPTVEGYLGVPYGEYKEKIVANHTCHHHSYMNLTFSPSLLFAVSFLVSSLLWHAC